MSQSTFSKSKKKESVKGITGISVRGYKSLYEECSIEVHPLTILAGANSSGKSSIMQPLLMLKQTLEATYDPGALLLNGPNIHFTSARQLFSNVYNKNRNDSFSNKVEIENNQAITTSFKIYPRKAIQLVEMTYEKEGEKLLFSPEMLPGDIIEIIPKPLHDFFTEVISIDTRSSQEPKNKIQWSISRNRCFFEFGLSINRKKIDSPLLNLISSSPSEVFEPYIRKIIHVPGLRGNPERTYKTTAIGSEFPGTFENYVASVVNHWQKTKDKRLKDLGSSLETLGLTCKVEAKQIDDTQVELRVSRLCSNSKSGAKDMVSIADVGFGVSQTLPVLVALLVAQPGQLVYLEEPEIHLHPRAQAGLAQVLADAANRGVRLVVETHSSLLLLAVQSLVAEGNISSDNVKLYWFTRRDDGVTEVSAAKLDEAGAFGDWPEDFSEVALEVESRYLNAAESRQRK